MWIKTGLSLLSSPLFVEFDCPAARNTSPTPTCSIVTSSSRFVPAHARTVARYHPPAGNVNDELKNSVVVLSVTGCGPVGNAPANGGASKMPGVNSTVTLSAPSGGRPATLTSPFVRVDRWKTCQSCGASTESGSNVMVNRRREFVGTSIERYCRAAFVLGDR